MLSAGALIELTPEKPVVGGRMLARVNGEVVLVAGAIPDERIIARIERRQQGVWFAAMADVLDASTDRRDPGPDPGCGGMTFAHIAYARQTRLKAEIVIDAFARSARLQLPGNLPFTASPVEGYRTRYRVHPGRGGLGFYREGTHDICDASASGQLALASVATLRDLASQVAAFEGAGVDAFECMENLANNQRVVNLSMREGSRPSADLVSAVAETRGLSGVTWTGPRPTRVNAVSGCAWVSDSLESFAIHGVSASPITNGEPRAAAELRRHAPAFFQANRFLTPVLARKVVDLVGDGPVVDLYAGVGLFAVLLAATGRSDVTAIEADAISAHDLATNALPYEGRLSVLAATVEGCLEQIRIAPDTTLIVDPPRTGMSRVAMQRVMAARPARIVYVSCDVATLARDTRRLIDAGFGIVEVEALDMFPNTAHVEAIATFDRM